MVDRLRQQQEQEQRPQAQTDVSAHAAQVAAIVAATWAAPTEAARRCYDTIQPAITPLDEQAGPSQEASQLPDVSAHGNAQRERGHSVRSGTATNAAAVLDQLLAEVQATKVQQAGRADTGSTGTGQQPRLQPPAWLRPPAEFSNHMAADVTQQAIPAGEASSNLHGSSHSAEASTSEQSTSGASAVMLDGQAASAAMLEKMTGTDQQPVAPGQSVAKPMQKPVLMRQQQPVVPEQLGFKPKQGGTSLPEQQAVGVEQLGGQPEQGPSFHQQADASPHETDTAAADTAAADTAAADTAAAPDRQAVRNQEPLVMLPQQAAVPLPQPRPLALAPQQRQIAAPLNEEPMAFEELVGLRGPIRMLFENAGTVIFSSAMFMAAALWAPFMWGRITIRGIAMAQTAWKLSLLPAAAMQLLLKTHQVCSQTACASAVYACITSRDSQLCTLCSVFTGTSIYFTSVEEVGDLINQYIPA